MEKIDKLNYRPFTRFCMSIGAVPSSYIAGLTIEEQILWFCSYLEKEVIPAVNNNGEAVTELQGLYVELKNYVDNYFDNLDVQDEIDNKLDDMVEQGVLQEIIATYLNANALWCFDTVDDMIDATNLMDGSFAKTLGYYSLNDGGQALYKIRTKNENEITNDGTIIELSDTLVAELIYNDKINVLSLGIKRNDNEYDASTIINNLIDNKENNIKLYFPVGKYYISNITIPEATNDIEFIGDSAFSLAANSSTCSVLIPISGTTGTLINVSDGDTSASNMMYNFKLTNIEIYGNHINNINAISIGRASNVNFNNVRFTGVYGYALSLNGVYDSIFNNVEIADCGTATAQAVILNGTTTANNAIRFTNCRFEGCRQYLLITGKEFQNMFTNCKFEANGDDLSTSGITLEQYADVSFTGCDFVSKSAPSYYFIKFNNPAYEVRPIINGCFFQCSSPGLNGGKFIDCSSTSYVENIIISNNTFKHPYSQGALKLKRTSFTSNTIIPGTFNEATATHFIEVVSDCVITSNYLLGNSGANPVFAFKLTGSNNIIKDNNFQIWNITKRYDGIDTYPQNTLDYAQLTATSSSITGTTINASLCPVVYMPGSTTLDSVINSWIGCELTLYGNGSGCVIDFTGATNGINLVYNYITSLTVGAGKTATLRKVTDTKWMLISSN